MDFFWSCNSPKATEANFVNSNRLERLTEDPIIYCWNFADDELSLLSMISEAAPFDSRSASQVKSEPIELDTFVREPTSRSISEGITRILTDYCG